MEGDMDWSIHDIARMTGTTSRTLRHYSDIGLLTPSRIGQNGYRYYNQDALMRLQRILLLRELGLSLKSIAEVLANETDVNSALIAHLGWLRQEQQRLAQQIASVETTLRKTKEGGQLMAEEMFEGFDHTHYKDEVIQRWGRDAYESGDRWWRSLTEAESGDSSSSNSTSRVITVAPIWQAKRWRVTRCRRLPSATTSG